jgi:hypothetical protein
MSPVPASRSGVARGGEVMSLAPRPRPGAVGPSRGIICSVLVAACLGMSATPALAAARPGSVFGPASANRALAHREVLGLLRKLRLPGDARRTLRAPHGTRGRLSRIPGGSSSRHLVDAHSFWESIDPPGAVLRYVAHHLPPGVLFSTRTAGGGSNGVGFLRWQLHAPPGLATRAVAVSAVALPSGLTAVRLEAAAEWVSPRPGWDRVPAGAAIATVAGHGARRTDVQAVGPESRSVILTGRTDRRLAGWIDRQPAAQPGLFASCGFGADSALTVEFLDPSHRLLARATETVAGGCGALSLTIRGRTGPALTDGGLEQELVRLHVVRSCRADELSVPSPVRRQASGGPALVFTLHDTSREICTAVATPSIVLIGARGHVLVGHDLRPPVTPPAVLYPESAESVTAEFQSCPGRPRARRARVRLTARLAWNVILTGRAVRPCAEPLTLVTGAASRPEAPSAPGARRRATL